MLLFFDGFDFGLGGQTAGATRYASTAQFTYETSLQRTGASCLEWGSAAGNFVTKTLPATGAAVVGIAQRLTVTPSAEDLVQIREGTTVHVALAVDGSGHLQVKRGATVLATGTTVLPLGTWYYLEIKVVIHDTAGSYEVRLDTIPELSASGVDTRNGGTTGQWDTIVCNALSSADAHLLDDFYICDGSGPRNTDFLGPVKVEQLLPVTDAVAAGSNAGLTPSTGTDHGALVDENPPNTTDYNSSATVGAKDTYKYPALTLAGAVLGVQTALYVAKSDAAARTVCAVIRSGGVDYDGANVSPGTTFGYLTEVREVDPSTGLAWTAATVNALEAGMKVTA